MILVHTTPPFAQRRSQHRADEVTATGNLLRRTHDDVFEQRDVRQRLPDGDGGTSLIGDGVQDNEQINVAFRPASPRACDPNRITRSGRNAATMRSTIAAIHSAVFTRLYPWCGWPQSTKITDAIVSAVGPVEVILFGSYARGNARSDSDLDLLVIEERPFGPEHSRRADFGRILRALADILVPIDVLLYSRGEVERFAESRGHIIADALREGRVLHGGD